MVNMKLFSNKPFIALFIINMIYLTSLIDINRLIIDTKSNIKIILVNMGLKKYKDNRELESDELVIYFNMEKSIKINKIVRNNHKTFLNDIIFHEPGIYKWGGRCII